MILPMLSPALWVVQAVAELLVAAETGSMQAVVALGNRYITVSIVLVESESTC